MLLKLVLRTYGGTVILEMQKYVIGLLRNYNQMKQEIEALGFELKRLDTEGPEETIEAMAFSFSAEERITGGNVSDKTPDIALTYAKKHEELKATAICEINARLRFLNDTINRLDFYIERLPAHQATVIRQYYFEGYSWRDIESLTGVSYKTLARHKNNALKTMTQGYLLLEKLGVLDFSNKTPTLFP